MRSSSMNNAGRNLWWLLALPGVGALGFLFFAPVTLTIISSFGVRPSGGGVAVAFSLQNYRELADPAVARIVLRTLALAAINTAICLVLALPIAWHLVFTSKGLQQRILLVALVMPLWITLLVRVYGFFALLRPDGLFPALMGAMGADIGPILFSNSSTMLGLVSGYLPLMLLPIFVSLERLSGTHLLAVSADLGATPPQTMRRVVLPLIRPGIVAGCALVFIPSLGSYVVPALLGGGRSYLIGNLVSDEFLTSRDPGRAYAISTLLIAAVAFLAVVRPRSTGISSSR